MIPGSANPLLLKSAAVAGPVQIERSLRFNSSDSGYCSRTFTSAGNRKTWTWAAWVKRSELVFSTQYSLFGNNGNSDTTFGLIAFFNNNIIVGGFTINYLATSAVYRDPGAWMHIVVAMDTTQATASNRLKVYVNGSEVTVFSTDNRSSITQNSDQGINQAVSHAIGRQDTGSGSSYFSGYLADIHFIDGQALTPSSFTEVSATTGQLIPKAYTGSFGTNGFWLKFSDNSAATAAALGNDYSGNNNDWTPNNLSVTAGAGNDSLVDTPTSYGTDTGAGGEVRGNYATWNPLDKGSEVVLTNGNLDITWSNVNGHSVRSSFAVGTGKWYWEVIVGANSSVGLIAASIYPLLNQWPGNSAYGSTGSYAYAPNGNKVNNSSYASYGSGMSNGDIVGVAYDADNGKLYFSLNGTWQASGNPSTGANAAYTGISGTYCAAVGYWQPPTTNVNSVNFGQRPFAYTAPSGFKALCDTNLTAPVVAKPNTVMDVKLYTGNAGNQTISGFSFSPDFIWTKSRSQAYSHNIYDSVRGISKNLFANETSAENTDANTIKAFNSDGFQLGSNDNGNYTNNGSAVAWCWDAGSAANPTTNTQGSITSSVRANPSSGFSIVGYTGTGSSGSLGHGLNVKPQLIIVKSRTQARDWLVYHSSYGATQYMTLNGTGAAAATTSAWNNTEPTSTVFTIGNAAEINTNGSTNIAYCFAPVVGYSSFGSYIANASADGPFVYLGFRPRWIMIKAATNAGDMSYASWLILDTSRSSYNICTESLYANASYQEGLRGNGTSSGTYLDILSNGFKIKYNGSEVNGVNGQTYVYAAFAESPFQYARAR